VDVLADTGGRRGRFYSRRQTVNRRCVSGAGSGVLVARLSRAMTVFSLPLGNECVKDFALSISKHSVITGGCCQGVCEPSQSISPALCFRPPGSPVHLSTPFFHKARQRSDWPR